MKINKINKLSQFQNEGKSPEELPENDTTNDQSQLNQDSFGGKGMSHTSEIINNISNNKPIGIRIKSSFVANGSVAWFKFDDNIIYEILVSPAKYGHYFNYFQSLLNNNNDNQNTTQDNPTQENLP